LEGKEPYLLISMILRHSQLGFAGVMECSLVAAVDEKTYVFGVTSTAFVWSEARRKMTHELGRMPLLDAMIGRIYLSFGVNAVHRRLPKIDRLSAEIFFSDSNDNTVAKFSQSKASLHMSRSSSAPDRTLCGADHAENNRRLVGI